MSDRIAVGAKLFSRETKCQQLLQSIPDTVDTIYVADDGRDSPADRDVFDLVDDDRIVTLDMPYDAGLGAGRKAIVEEMDEDYLCIVDTDMEVPNNVDALAEMLDADQTLGGVSGLLREDGEQTGLFHDLAESRCGRYLYRTLDDDKAVEATAGGDIVRFDFIPNAAMFRREALEAQSWDPQYVIGREHLDFYVAHWKRTPYDFAVGLDVTFPHHPGGSSGYMRNRTNHDKLVESEQYFRDKWEYDAVVSVEDWFGRSSGDRALHPLPTPEWLKPEWCGWLKAKRELIRQRRPGGLLP